MPIKHQIVDNTEAVPAPGMDMLNQLSGLIGMAQSMLGAGVSLPGIQGIGSQIAGMGSAITAGGGAAGSSTDTSSISNVMTSMGSNLSQVTSMLGASGIIGQMSGLMSQLTNMINPASAGQQQTKHSTILDAAKGIIHSAFQGKHTVGLGEDGINLQSIAKIATTAPQIPHNGLTTVSDALQVSKIITGSGFGITSDERLKSEIVDHEDVLPEVMKLKVKRFKIKTVNWENGQVSTDRPRPSIGLIAQDVQDIFPDIVREDWFLTLDEGKVGMKLLSAFQEFVLETREEIATLKAEIERLKK